jgi:amino acid transporter
MSISVREQKIGLFGSVMIGATCMVGSGWLFAPLIAAQLAGNYAFLSWIVSAAFILAVAFCFIYGFVKYPFRGITARIISITHNSSFGLPFAFVNWFGIIATVATEAQASTQYLAFYLGETFATPDGLTIYGKLLGVILLCLFLLVNYFGIRFLAKVNNVVTIIKFATPVIVLVALVIAHFSFSNFTDTVPATPHDMSSVLVAMIGAGMIYSFNGFQTIGSFAGEIDKPERNLALAFFISVVLVLCFYLVIQFVFMAAMPASYLTNGWENVQLTSPMINLTAILGLHIMSVLLILNAVISPSATGFTYLGSSARMLSGMSHQKQAPKFLQKMCPKYHFSKSSMVTNFIVAIIFFLNSSGWANLMVTVAIFNIMSYMAAPISMGALKKHRFVGWIIFLLICGLIATADHENIVITCEALVVVAVIFIFTNGLHKAWFNFLSVLPFYVLLFAGFFTDNMIAILILASVFYWFTISDFFIQFCKTHKEDVLAE